MERMRQIDWQSCFSMSDMPELEKLEEWTRSLHEQRGRELRILEIGSFQGKSTALLAQCGPVIAIDLWANVDDGLASKDGPASHDHFKAFVDNMRRLGLVEHVHPIISTSKILNILPPLNLDLAFVDASHSYVEAKKDITRTMLHVQVGGLMVVHDVKRPGFGYPPFDPNHPHHGPCDPWGGVARSVDELLETGSYRVYEHFLGIMAIERVR